MSDLFLNPPPWPVILALSLLACVLFMAAAVLVALIPPRRTPMPKVIARTRKAWGAGLAVVGAYFASKGLDLNAAADLVGKVAVAVLTVYFVPNKALPPTE